MIYPEDVRRFVVSNPIAFDLRKVDQLWFMDLLTNRNTEPAFRRIAGEVQIALGSEPAAGLGKVCGNCE